MSAEQRLIEIIIIILVTIILNKSNYLNFFVNLIVTSSTTKRVAILSTVIIIFSWEIYSTWLPNMFTSTDYLFNPSTTWEYMNIILLIGAILLCLVIIFEHKISGNMLDIISKLFWISILTTWSLGTIYYLNIVLNKALSN